jgi:exopolysaccharide biosynthesis polyprenyl glycosylphosphotransferase
VVHRRARANAENFDAVKTANPAWVESPGQGLLLGRSDTRRDPLLRRLLAVADLTAALVGMAALGAADQVLWALLVAPIWIVLAKLQGLYDRDQRALRHLTVDEAGKIAVWAIAGTGAVGAALLVAPGESLSIGDACRVAAVAFVCAVLLRAGARWIWRRVTPPQRTMIVGSGPLADAVRRKLELFDDIHVAVVEERPQLSPAELNGDASWLAGVDRVILASQSIDEASIRVLVAACRAHNVRLSVVPPSRGMFGTAVELNFIADLPVVEYNTWDVPRSTMFLKRVLDVFVSATLLTLASPLLVLIAVAIKLDSRGPVLFAQRRAGLGGREFRMLKFRTMVTNAEELLDDLIRIDELPTPMFKLRDDPRVTRVGRVLRRWSLDELPQLLNVLGGSMSLVGPRPEQVELVERYAPEHRFRLDVKPGLTGPMQVHGRGHLSFEERIAVEREYVENLSLGRDLRILGLTLPAVFGGRGAF